MDHDQVLILAPAGPRREALEAVFLRLGRTAATPHPAEHTVPAAGAAIVVDLRGGDDDLRQMTPALHADLRPLMVVAEAPSPMILELQNRPGGLALLTGAESDGGYRVALRICEALSARELTGASAEALPLAG